MYSFPNTMHISVLYKYHHLFVINLLIIALFVFPSFALHICGFNMYIEIHILS